MDRPQAKNEKGEKAEKAAQDTTANILVSAQEEKGKGKVNALRPPALRSGGRRKRALAFFVCRCATTPAFSFPLFFFGGAHRRRRSQQKQVQQCSNPINPSSAYRAKLCSASSIATTATPSNMSRSILPSSPLPKTKSALPPSRNTGKTASAGTQKSHNATPPQKQRVQTLNLSLNLNLSIKANTMPTNNQPACPDSSGSTNN